MKTNETTKANTACTAESSRTTTRKNPRLAFVGLSLLFLSITLCAALVKDSAMFGTLFVIVLAIAIGYDLFLYGPLGELTLSGLGANARFIRQKAEEAKDYSLQIAQQKQNIDAVSEEILKFRNDLADQIDKLEDVNGMAAYTYVNTFGGSAL